jgi:hypothetical protein
MLVSPLQSVPCVFYRARITTQRDASGADLLEEERAVGFTLRDAGGAIRVFPRGAAFDVPDRLDESSGALGETPPSVRLRSGSAIADDAPAGPALDPFAGFGRPSSVADSGARRFREARIEPGEVVTVLGRAMPFVQLDDPDGADVALGSASLPADDPEVAADLAAAGVAGLLTDPADAWGNAAIPGFGIGRPTRAPELDPAATDAPLASPAEAERAARTFDIGPDTLVLASAVDVPLLVAAGGPGVAVARHESRFLVGLLGAALAIVSAVVLALALSGGLDAIRGAAP